MKDVQIAKVDFKSHTRAGRRKHAGPAGWHQTEQAKGWCSRCSQPSGHLHGRIM